MLRNLTGTYGLVVLLALTGCSDDETGKRQVEVAPQSAVPAKPLEPSPSSQVDQAKTSASNESAMNSQKKTLNLSLPREQMLAEQQPSGGFSNPGAAVKASTDEQERLKRSLNSSDSEVSLSGGLITKENEPDYQQAVEGARVGIEVKY